MVELHNEPKLEAGVLSDISQCYLQLQMHEDALHFANLAIEKATPEEKAEEWRAVLFLKATALSYLGEFDESIKMLELIKLPDEVKFV
jgi:tetratricopeptide (TPR) repeat protein